jgi:GAF domain-containing protein
MARRKDKLAGIITGDFATDYKNVELLIDTIAAINATSDIGELLTLTVDKVVEATGAERGALMLADGGGRRLTTVVARDRRRQNLRLVEKFSRTIPERVLETGAPVCVIDAAAGADSSTAMTIAGTGARSSTSTSPSPSPSPSTSTSTSPSPSPGGDAGAESGAIGTSSSWRTLDPAVIGSASVVDLDLRTILCVPLATKERTIGVIYVDSRTRSGDLRESSLPFFEALARQVAFAIENARLKARLAYEGGAAEP